MHFSGGKEECQITLPKECGMVDDEEKGIDDGELVMTE